MPAAPPSPSYPVVVGVGIISQREEDPLLAAEPIELMIRAVRQAEADAGAPLLSQIDRISVPHGRWSYSNPAAMIGAAVGSPRAHTTSAMPGVSQQTILSDAASAISCGDAKTALVVGGEAGYRLRCGRRLGVELTDTDDDLGHPDVLLTPDDDIVPEYERSSGLGVMPVGYYALIDSAYRRTHGIAIDEYRQALTRRYARFSEIAVANPYGWSRDAISEDALEAAAFHAFPYTKHHVSDWSVDQASALLFTTVAEAQRLGIPESRWVYPQAFSEANHQLNVTARGELHRCVGAELAALAALDAAGCTAADMDLIELYTCFPIAAEIFADAIGLAPHRDWSFTGGMSFAGGPFNNFVLHSCAQLVQRLRTKSGSRGLVSTVSGFLTKQGIGIWGANPNPRGFQFVDVTERTAIEADERKVDPSYTGPASIAAYTVLHTKAGRESGVVVVDLPDGGRSLATTHHPPTMERMEREDIWALPVHADRGSFSITDDETERP